MKKEEDYFSLSVGTINHWPLTLVFGNVGTHSLKLVCYLNRRLSGVDTFILIYA